MGRRKVDRSDKIMQSFETTRPLKVRLEELAKERGIKGYSKLKKDELLEVLK